MGQGMFRGKTGELAGVCVITIVVLLGVFIYAQEDYSSCPRPYIKLIKPNIASVGDCIVIRGHRFGVREESSAVIFHPGVAGKIVSWSHTRITVEVPPGAATGNVVVTTKCSTSNGEFFKVGE